MSHEAIGSQVKVPPHTLATACLIVQEENLSVRYSVEGSFHVVGNAVSIEKRKGKIVHTFEIPRNNFADLLENFKNSIRLCRCSKMYYMYITVYLYILCIYLNFAAWFMELYKL